MNGVWVLCIAALAADPVCIEPNPKHGQSAAVRVDGGALAHTALVLGISAQSPPTEPADQVSQGLSRLNEVLSAASSSLKDAVKIHVYVNHPSVTPHVERALASRFNGKHQPAVSYVQTSLPEPHAVVGFDAIAVSTSDATDEVRIIKPKEASLPTEVAILPAGPVDFISGQAERGDGTLADATRLTLQSLFATLKFLKRSPSDVAHIKAFLTPMSESAVALKEIMAAFAGETAPPVSFVEWNSTLPIEIELVVAGPRTDRDPNVAMEILTPPGLTASPVFARVTRLNRTQRLYVSGLFAGEELKDPAREAKAVFEELRRIVELGGSDFHHLAKATYYVTSTESSQAVNNIRPGLYDPKHPPAASKAQTTGVGRPGRSLTLDMIAVPIE